MFGDKEVVVSSCPAFLCLEPSLSGLQGSSCFRVQGSRQDLDYSGNAIGQGKHSMQEF